MNLMIDRLDHREVLAARLPWDIHAEMGNSQRRAISVVNDLGIALEYGISMHFISWRIARRISLPHIATLFV